MSKCVIKLVVVMSLILLGFSFQACSGNDSKQLFEPNLDKKTDVMDQVNYQGKLTFGSDMTGEFKEDFQFDAYAFEVRKGAVVTIETTHQGSSASLDSTMFLYGPADKFGVFEGPRLTQDDDSGWGKLARIDDFEIPEEGSYLAVLGTADGSGRGKYRVVIICESEACEPKISVDVECSFDLLETMDSCMEERIYDYGEPVSEALDWCAERLLWDYEDLCEYEPVPPAYCAIDIDTFENQVIPECVEKIKKMYPEPEIVECDEDVRYYLEDCVEVTMVEENVTPETAIERCVDRYNAEYAWDYVCESGYGGDWCQLGFTEFFEVMIPLCKEVLENIDW